MMPRPTINRESNALLRDIYHAGKPITFIPNHADGTVTDSDGRVFQVVTMTRPAESLPLLPIQSKSPRAGNSTIVRWQGEKYHDRKRRLEIAKVKNYLMALDD